MTLLLSTLRAVNVARCVDGFHQPLDRWSLYDWVVALGGEVGEALNLVKKLNRDRDGLGGNSKSAMDLRADLADELADGIIYADLLMAAAGQSFSHNTLFNIVVRDVGGPPFWATTPLSAFGAYVLSAAGRLATRCHEIEIERETGVVLLGPESLVHPTEALVSGLVMIADCVDVKLDDAVVSKFNRTSEKRGVPHHRLELS